MPSRVHFFWSGPDFAYADLLSVRTAQRVHQPESIWVWTGQAPAGNAHWDAMMDLEGVSMKPLPPHPGRTHNRYVLSDYIRYHVLFVHGGLYLDFDTISLRPLSRPEGCSVLAGEERPGILNIAVLDVEAGSPVFKVLLEACERRLTQTEPDSQSFNMLGPALFTDVCRAHPGQVQVVPPEVFYPIHWQNWQLVWSNCLLPAATRVLHYWGTYGHERARLVEPGQREPTTYHRAVSSVLGDDW